jgi:hypothetical protein
LALGQGGVGALKNRIKKAKKALECCRRGPLDQRNISREHVLRFKLSRLEDQHSTFWQQRAHANWLKYGDRNTSYFHAFDSERKKVNRIKKLRREEGGVVEIEEEIGTYITNHYKSLFMSSTGPPNDELLDHVPNSVMDEMNNSLS